MATVILILFNFYTMKFRPFDFLPRVSARIPQAMFSLTCRASLPGLTHKLQSAILTYTVDKET